MASLAIRSDSGLPRRAGCLRGRLGAPRRGLAARLQNPTRDPDASLVQAMINILPQVGMLVVMAIGLLGLARVLARRWDGA